MNQSFVDDSFGHGGCTQWEKILSCVNFAQLKSDYSRIHDNGQRIDAENFLF